ncbi:hypothetical protein ACVWXO_001819 [Bradyrhizobium sp. LM2.7]
MRYPLSWLAQFAKRVRISSLYVPLWHSPKSTKRKWLGYDTGMQSTGHKVSSERLEDLRRIYKELSGDEIATEEATEMAHRLLAL